MFKTQAGASVLSGLKYEACMHIVIGEVIL